MASLLSFVKNKVQQVEHGVGQAAHVVNQDVVQPAIRDVYQPIQHVAAPVERAALNTFAPVAPAIQATQHFAAPISRGFNTASNFIAQHPLNIPVVKPFETHIVAPTLKNYGQTIGHTGQILHGHNPYHGTAPQIAGQVGNDLLNATSVLPVGAAVKGVQAGVKGERLLPSVAKSGLINAGFGGGYGASQAAQQKGATIKSVATAGLKNAAISGVVGASLPLGARGVRVGAQQTAKVIDNRTPLNEAGAVGKNVSGVGGETYYHGGTPIDKSSIAKSDLGYSVTTDKNTAKWFTNTKDGSSITEHTISPNAKLLHAKDIPQELKDNFSKLDPNKSLLENIQQGPALTKDAERKIVAYARSKGYDGIDMRGEPFVLKGKGVLNNEAEIRILNPDIIVNKPPTPVSAVGKTVNKVPSASELKMGKALGMTPKDVAVAKNTNSIEAAHPKLTPEDLANLSPTEQMKIASPNHTPLADQSINTAKNPFKANIPQVGHNDFSQVIANEQVASELGKDNVLRSMAQAQKKSPDEFKNFWEYANRDPGFEAPKSPEMQQALKAWRTADNRIHGNSQALGGNTNYLENHGLHPVVFNEDVTKQLINGTDPNKFAGLNNLSRKHPTMASLRASAEKHGFSVGTDPLSEANNYLSASEHSLRRRAIIKGVGEADGANLEKTHNLTLGVGDKNSVPVSDLAHNELRGLQRSTPTSNQIVRGARTANVATKSTLLSFGQFHPNNISLMRAAPATAIPKPSTLIYRNRTTGKLGIDPTMSAHPVRAAKGLYATYRPLVPGSGTNFAAKVNARAVADGTDIKAARIGAPYNAQLFDAAGSNIAGVGHKLLGRQMLGMHDQAVRSVLSDLKKRGIPLDSAEARTAGRAVNNMMGFVNNEAQKIPPVVSRQLGDWLLARQFTHSKFSQLRNATQGGVGGAYARANVAANVAASTAVITGVGYALQQKSDNIRDSLIRALTDPAIPTPMKDSKGNTVKLRLPGTDASDVAKLLGIKPVRQADGHLGISWSPGNMPSTVADFARARLAPIPGLGLKVATNTNYAGKPLYDPNAKFGTKVEQASVIGGSGLLPIGAQGVPMTGAVEKHLPGNVQDVLNANKPGGNPLVKSLASSFGVTPTTDATVGKGLQSSQYFSALDGAKQGLNNKEKDVLDLYAGSKKNPVTGKYDVQPNANDTATKARALLDQPKVIDNLISMNSKLSSQGQKVDPLWQQSKDQITKVLQYQAMPPGGADRTHWLNANKGWYLPLSDQRSTFFGSLPKGDPNKPQAPIEYPNASPSVANQQQKFFNITDSGQRAKFLQDHPDVQTQLDAQVEYNNKMREAQGYSALDKFPKAPASVQGIIDTYNSIPKGGGKKGGNLYRAQWIQSHPKDFAAMTNYFTQASLYGLEKDANQAQFQDTGFSPKGLGDIYNLGKNDIKQGKDKTGKNTYALTTGQSGGATYTDTNGNTFADLGQGSGSSSFSPYSKKPKSAKSLASSFKITKPAKLKKLTAPKGVKVKKVAYSSLKTRKVSTTKIPKMPKIA